MVDDDALYAAMLARDYRFDGKFFVGVMTTGVYCRPICPARPSRKNVQFFSSAREAERAGFRPCLRCRPESAPASPAWIGKSAVVQRALRLVASGGLVDTNGADFAARFGMTSRHLRRLFAEEIGQTPKQIADIQRLNFARTLAVETTLPILEIANGSGFSSLRRFNEAFRERFGRSPTEVRRKGTRGRSDCLIRIVLPFRPPFDSEFLFRFFAHHATPYLEIVDKGMYERVFQGSKGLSVIRISRVSEKQILCLETSAANSAEIFSIVRRVRTMFDLDSDPLLIANAFDSSPALRSINEENPGLRMPGCWDGFETSVHGILGQFVSAAQTTRLCRILMESLGEKRKHPFSQADIYLFPSAARIAESKLSFLRVSERKRVALREFSKCIASERLSLSDAQDPQHVRKQLMEIPGIGRRTANYISIRVLSDTDVFLDSDCMVRKALASWPNLQAKSLSPWRSYLTLKLWRSVEKRRKEKL